MNTTFKKLIIPLIVSLLYFYTAFENLESNSNEFYDVNAIVDKVKDIPTIPIEYLTFRDTIYIFGNTYIITSLKEQVTYLYERNKKLPITYKISSGNPNIPEGMETTTGLFTVQNKNPLGISKQFSDAELHNWIGFNFNIGFHGLVSNGYYSLLGIRPSSHGCIRMSREDGADLYKRVVPGTPVLVYKREPAVVLAFADSNLIFDKNIKFLPSDSRIFKKEMNKRIKNLYNGFAHISNTKKLAFDGTTIVRYGGYPIGNSDSIYYKQKLHLYKNEFLLIKKDILADNLNIKSKFIIY